MRIAMVSGDEVNRDLAQRMIPDGMQLECSLNGSSRQHVDAWIYDLDQLPPVDRSQILQMLTGSAPQQPVAVLSYALPRSVLTRLRSNGILIRRRLDARVFPKLAACHSRKSEKVSAHSRFGDNTLTSQAVVSPRLSSRCNQALATAHSALAVLREIPRISADFSSVRPPK